MSNRAGKGEHNKKLFWRLHHWVGLYTGILIGALSLTGAVAVFIPEIDGWIVKHHYNAHSSPSEHDIPQFGRSIDSLFHQYPDYNSLLISLPKHPGEVVQADVILQS